MPKLSFTVVIGTIRYEKTGLTRHMWLVLSVFLLLFNSTPVKKFIRICMSKQPAHVEYVANGEQISSNFKDCTIIERHTFLSDVSAVVHADHSDSSSDLQLLLWPLLSATTFFIALGVTRRREVPLYAQHPSARGGGVPVYLHIHKLQV